VASAIGAFRDPPWRVAAEIVSEFEPDASRDEFLRAVFFGKGNPFFEGAAGFGFRSASNFWTMATPG
jgi:hypothetical protein